MARRASTCTRRLRTIHGLSLSIRAARRSPKEADLWLQIRPGADDALALAMLNVIIGEKLYDAPFVTQWTHGFDTLVERVKDCTPNGPNRSPG